MIITISGDAGSGKSSVAKFIARKLAYKHYSVGDFMRKIASKREKSLLEISRLAETDISIDEELDDMQRGVGKFEDNVVIDSRLGFHFIPKSFKVFLKVDPNVAANRIFEDKRIGETENKTIDKTLKNILSRKESELKRYKAYYNLNPYDAHHYDLVLDTSNSTIESTSRSILAKISQ